MPEGLRLSFLQFAQVARHVEKCAPEEACGILAGNGDGKVKRVFLMENSAHSPTFYEMDSQEQFSVFDEMEKSSLDLVAIFHSHPHSPAQPSARDVELAFYPDAFYLIVTLMNGAPEGRAFRIQDGRVREVKFIVDGLKQKHA